MKVRNDNVEKAAIVADLPLDKQEAHSTRYRRGELARPLPH
ncbi:MAG: hypothetical protein WBZ36_30565 [Candidatus Nitrosopolaris sp.]